MAGKGNIFRIKKVYNEQTINTNRFSLRFIGLTDLLLNKAPISPLFGVQTFYNAVKNALGGDPATSVEISLIKSNLPLPKLEVAEIPRFNDQFKTVTKFAPMDMFNVDFVDYVNGSTSAIMQLWRAFVGDKRTGAIGFKQDYVLPIANFYVYGPDAPGYSDEYCDEHGGPPYLQKYEIVNLYPVNVNMPDHDAAAGEFRKVNVEFACDNIYPAEIYTYNYTAANPLERYQNAAAVLGTA